MYEQAYRLAGVSSPLRVDDLLFNEIINEVEQPKARKIMEISKGRANVYAVEIEHNSRSIGLTIVDITSERGFPRDVVFMGIFRNRRKDFLIPHGDTRLMEGDLVFLVSNDTNIKKATSLLTDSLD
jgi:trk system potassium uptake protein TrkA